MLPVALFLDVPFFGDVCRSGDMCGRASLSIATEMHMLGMQNINSTRYTLTVSAADFPLAKEKTVFTYQGNNYKALKPPIVKEDALVFVCDKQ